MKQQAPNLAQWQQQMISCAQKAKQDSSEFNEASRHRDKSTSLFVTPDNLAKRLNAYKNNYHVTLIQWLKKTYPMTERMVGSDYFRQLANSFIKEHPLTDSSLDNYGSEFAIHIDALSCQRPELSGLPFLTDLALADWYLHCAYYAVNRSIFDVQAFSKLSQQEQLKVELCIGEDLFVIESTWPIKELWAMHYQQTAIDKIVESDQSYFFLVQRTQAKPTVALIERPLFEFFQEVVTGSTIADLSIKFSELIPHTISQGWITGFRIK
ncbi:MAG: DNA-binding domain-containing protein [Pseudomonadales bacterium]|nr:DNA-binding domain-containing protein [Pseudomonadales bacterium]